MGVWPTHFQKRSYTYEWNGYENRYKDENALKQDILMVKGRKIAAWHLLWQEEKQKDRGLHEGKL